MPAGWSVSLTKTATTLRSKTGSPPAIVALGTPDDGSAREEVPAISANQRDTLPLRRPNPRQKHPQRRRPPPPALFAGWYVVSYTRCGSQKKTPRHPPTPAVQPKNKNHNRPNRHLPRGRSADVAHEGDLASANSKRNRPAQETARHKVTKKETKRETHSEGAEDVEDVEDLDGAAAAHKHRGPPTQKAGRMTTRPNKAIPIRKNRHAKEEGAGGGVAVTLSGKKIPSPPQNHRTNAQKTSRTFLIGRRQACLSVG